ncbi:MAG: ATP-dependent RecD-like DNA helicase [Bradymonadaceae bacterium]
MLKDRVAERLNVDEAMLGGPIDQLRVGDQLVVEPGREGDPPAAYRGPSHGAEVGAARQVRALLTSESWLGDGGIGLDLETRVDAIESELGFELAEAQREAVGAAWKSPVVVITGGPGTGKTTIVRAVCMLGDELGRKIELCAPTGRAAKRLSEATGRNAQTIHRLLDYSFEEGGFQYDEDRPLDVDMLIVDEASMLDTSLFHAVVRALPPRASLLLVGDVDQLPSVGPGDVLADLIRSGEIAVVELTEIFRQAERSTIVVNAHRINQGDMPVVPRREDGELVDFYTIAADSPETARDRIVRAVSERIPEAFGYNSVEDIQILAPMHRGDVGCRVLNEQLQERMNPGAETFEYYGREWTVGDRVMQTRNNYDLDVYNGDIGRITDVDEITEVVDIDFEGRTVRYPFASLDELELAYAITVHKSQGSEYPAVVIPVVTQHYIMLQRNLLYTAVTRAEKLVVLVGSQRAVSIAVDNDEAGSRYTRLDRRIRGEL